MNGDIFLLAAKMHTISVVVCISFLYKHMKFRDIDEAILDNAKEKLLEGFRDEEEFDYMAGDEPWEKLIFDR